MRKILPAIIVCLVIVGSGFAQGKEPPERPPVIESVKPHHPHWRKLRHMLVVIVKKPTMAWVRAMAQDGR